MALVRTAKVTGKGRVTVPIAVRKALKLEGGDVVRFVLDGDGARIEVEAAADPVTTWAGAWREGQGSTKDDIVRDERELRGWEQL